MKKNTTLALSGAVILLTFGGALTYYLTNIGCSPTPSIETTNGSQGYRTWSGPSLLSFEHEDKKICVEEGWRAVGEKESGNGWVRFGKDETGVLIRSADFAERKLTFVFSAYEVSLVYPLTTSETDLELYEGTVRNAFERIGKLFLDSKENEKHEHTVLVTPGIERTDGKTTPIYPDPRESLSIYVQPPTSSRGEELLIHAIAHLYNRQRTDLSEYVKKQSPIPPQDFQELEASWTELIYRTSRSGREARVRYLYNVHTAVQTGNFSLITSYPFSSSEQEFKAIRPSVILREDASFLEEQYAHYILAPLAMTAIDGLLLQNKSPIDLEKLLTRLHSGDANFFDELTGLLGETEVKTIRSWLLEGKTIPYELVQSGIESYAR